MVQARRKAAIVVALSILGGGVLAQTGQTNRPLDEKALGQIAEQVYKLGAAPGFAFLVWSHDSVAFAKGDGLADVASNREVSPDTRFAVGSITKQFTAAAV